MPIHRRPWAIVAGLAALTLVLAACGGGNDQAGGDDGPTATEGTEQTDNGDTPTQDGEPATGEPFVIAFQGPLSGPVGEFIGPAEDGMTDYFDHLNETGGVDGRPIEFRSVDAGLEVDRAVTTFEEFAADEEVLAVTGLGISLQMNSLLPLMEEHGLAGISITSSVADALPYTEWYFSWGDDLAGSGRAGLEYILNQNPDAQIGFMAYDTPVIHAQRDAVHAGIEESDATLVGSHLPPADATDVSTEMRDLIDSGAEWIFFGGATGGIFNSAMTTAQVAGFDGKILVAAAGGDRVDFEVAASDTYDYIATRYFKSPLETEDPGIQEMVETSGTNAERFYYTAGWALAQHIEETLKLCGDGCDRAGFRDALEEVPLTNYDDLAGGPLGFDEECHQGQRYLMFYSWDADAQEPVYTGETLHYFQEGQPCFVESQG